MFFSRVISRLFYLLDFFISRGSIATTGSAITWLKNIGLITSPKESGELASSVKDTGGVYFVPAYVTKFPRKFDVYFKFYI